MRIMINGRSLSGKDQVKDYLSDKYSFKSTSFAKPIYEIARDYFGRDMSNGRQYGDKELLINIGQKLREINPSIWVDYALNTINNSDYPFWVISDVRQKNEYIRCKHEGFIPIRVNSTLENRIERCKLRDGFTPTKETIELWSSEGECGADNFSYHEVYNNGSLEELYKQIDDIIEWHREQYKESVK